MNCQIPQDILPDGSDFRFWDDITEYAAVYHVAQRASGADDENPGTKDRPFRSVGKAAEVLQPGEKVIIHQGVYRESVAPPRGGSGPERMIAYEAARDERVVISGAEVWQPEVEPSRGWKRRSPADARIWMADLPADAFAGYNPFQLRNAYEMMDKYADLEDKGFLRRALMRRGMIFCDGNRLKQVYRYGDLLKHDGTFWVEDPGSRIHFRLPDDRDPEHAEIEFTAREQAFAPTVENLGYIRISGINFERAADGLPIPQRACVSTTKGHHWIIEDCNIEWANAVGLDLGAQHWNAVVPAKSGSHIVRRNSIRNCGICGLAAVNGNSNTLIEENLIERIGFQNLERMWETAGLKFHYAENCMIRKNVFRHIQHAPGLWLDCDNVNNRVTGNVFADIDSLLGAVFSELNYGINLIDHNIIWDIRNPEHSDEMERGPGIKADCNEKLIIANNFIGKTRGGAQMINLAQADRVFQGRNAVCRHNQTYNNIIVDVPLRLHLGRLEDNRSDGNLYHIADDDCSFEIAYPAPPHLENLAGWQEYCDRDQHSTEADIQAAFDPETLTLSWTIEGPTPECQPVKLGDKVFPCPTPGPVPPGKWQESLQKGKGAHQLPL